MAVDLVDAYSAVIINQNVAPSLAGAKIAFSSDTKFYQEFLLPPNYVRGDDADEQIVPPLTGFHLLTEVAAGTEDRIGLDWVIEYYILGSGWSPLEGASGTIFGAAVSGNKVWLEAVAANPIEIPVGIVGNTFRIGITSYTTPASPAINQEVEYDRTTQTLSWDSHVLNDFVVTPGIWQKANLRGSLGYVYQEAPDDIVYFTETTCPTSIWYSSPNPLANTGVTARASNGTTALTASGASLSFLFRVLGLAADSGTDVLGNTYRSAVRTYAVDNVNTANDESEGRIWMSKPNPSRFAVESLYYDIRKKMPQRYGAPNIIKNPNGESGAGLWYNNDTAAAATSSTTWAMQGTKSIRTSGTTGVGTTYPGLIYQGGTATNWARVKAGQKYSFRASVNIAAIPASSTYRFVYVRWADAAGTILYSDDTQVSAIAAATGVQTVSLAGFTAPSGAYYATVVAFVDSTVSTQAYDISIDQVMLVESATNPAYFDGNSVGYEWEGAANLSASIPIITPTIDDAAVVVDKMLVDPVTPGVLFSIYYSNEGVAGTNETEWENKLWTRVNGTFQANKREIHALPTPITAKFVKIEFSHLQAKSYNPGDQPRPIAYKKHPKWVLEYFMARVNSKNSLEARLMNKRVGVVFDAYDLGYNYYLDDINQEPDQPVEINGASDAVDNYLKDDQFIDQIDPITLTKINLAFEPYKSNINTWFNQSALANVLRANYNFASGYPAEEPDDPSGVQGDFRNVEVAFQNDIPAMFFFVTCRHKYREATASFSHNRAYFVGIRQISFSRENYTEAFDTDHYIEPAGDFMNIERNDFITTDGVMTTN